MALKIDKHMDRLQGLRQAARRRASPGERVMGSLFPGRYGSFTSWSQNRAEMVQHMRGWVMIAIDTIACKEASVMPNMAWVGGPPRPGLTVKACQRSLLGISGKGFGAEPEVNSKQAINLHSWTADGKTHRSLGQAPLIDYSSDLFKDQTYKDMSFSDGGHSFLTMGEYRSKALSVVKPHEELEPLPEDHPLRRLIENPNPVDTFFDVEYELSMFEELCGVSYEWIVPNGFGEPCERWCIPSHWVWPITRGGAYVDPTNPDAERLIQYYEVRPWGGMGSAGILRIPPDEIITTKWKSPINKIDGWSKLTGGAQWIDTDESISKSRWAQFINQARPEFWVKLGPGYEDPDDDRIARIESKFASKFQGEYNYGKPIITPNGAEVTPLSFTPSEMAYFQSAEQTRDHILALWRIPGSAVGLSKDMTYGSLLASLGALCSFCLNPRLAMRGQNRTKHLASRFTESSPAYSTMSGGGHGSGKQEKRIKIWYDDCLDQETECLTAEGWKRQEELTEDTRIACYDEPTGTLVYRKPKRIVRRQHDGVLHLWEGGRVNAAMTPRHRVYVSRMSRKVHKWEYNLAGDQIPARGYKVLRAAPAACDVPAEIPIKSYGGGRQQLEGEDLSIDPRLWLQFIGYFISEGHLQRNKGPSYQDKSRKPESGSWLIYISQADDNEAFKNIQKCVGDLLGNWKQYRKPDKRYKGGDKHVQFVCNNRGLYEHLERNCGKGSANKKVPNYIKAWPAADLNVLLDALIEGDGRKPKVNANTGVWNSQYTTISKQLADDVMEIAIKCGRSASIISHTPSNPKHSIYYVVNLSSRTEVLVLPEHCKMVPYNGPVWCVEVPTGKFVVRRRGMAHITGNCVPADPQQVNSDLSFDFQAGAITPNEVRALRGRKPYKAGGDDPLLSGPGGMVPLPLNTGDSLQDLAAMIAPMTSAEGKGQQDVAIDQTPDGSVDPGDTGVPSPDTAPDGSIEPPDAPGDGLKPLSSKVGIEEPNGAPSKSMRKSIVKGGVEYANSACMYVDIDDRFQMGAAQSGIAEEFPQYRMHNVSPKRLWLDRIDGNAMTRSDAKDLEKRLRYWVDILGKPHKSNGAPSKSYHVVQNDNPKDREGQSGKVSISNRRTWIVVDDSGDVWSSDFKTQADAERRAAELNRAPNKSITKHSDADWLKQVQDNGRLGVGVGFFGAGSHAMPVEVSNRLEGKGLIKIVWEYKNGRKYPYAEPVQGVPSKSLTKSRTKDGVVDDLNAGPIAAGVCLLAEDTGRVLMLQRGLEEGDPNGGKWEFPGGKIDEGELAPGAAEREWYEETGLPRGSLVGALYLSSWDSGDGKYRGFVVQVPSEDSIDLLDRDLASNPDGDDFQAVAWIDADHFDAHNLRPALLEDVDLVRQAIGKHLKGTVAKGWTKSIVKGGNVSQAVEGMRRMYNDAMSPSFSYSALDSEVARLTQGLTVADKVAKGLGFYVIHMVRSAAQLSGNRQDSSKYKVVAVGPFKTKTEADRYGAIKYGEEYRVSPSPEGADEVKPTPNKSISKSRTKDRVIDDLNECKKSLILDARNEKGLTDSIQAAGAWLAEKWAKLEERYGRKTALTMASAALLTLPIPFNVAAIVAVAEGIRGIKGGN